MKALSQKGRADPRSHQRTPMDRPRVNPGNGPLCDDVVALDPFVEDSHFGGLFVRL